jgi:hypothetical protein
MYHFLFPPVATSICLNSGTSAICAYPDLYILGDTPYSSVLDRDLKNFLLAGKRLEKVDSCTDDM